VLGRDLQAVMAAIPGSCARDRPEVSSYSQLRGKTLSVDARTTGYAFVLIEMLEAPG